MSTLVEVVSDMIKGYLSGEDSSMSDSRVTDQTVRRRFPYPIAAAWHRMTLATTDSDRIRCLIACNEVLLRTLSAFLLPDYLRGTASPAVEATIRKLERPTDGIRIEPA